MGRCVWAAAGAAGDEAGRRHVRARGAQGDAGGGAAIRDVDLEGRMAGIGCPTLVVTGAGGTSTPLGGRGEHLLARIPGAGHVVLEAAHLAPLEAPEALAAALVSFLES